ncbi:hypothetical protein Tco_1489238 [Tanacetum coccineum]
MLKISLKEAQSEEEIFFFVAWVRAFNIREPIYPELFREFYATYEFDEVCASDELQSKKIIIFRLGGRAHSLTLLEFARRLGLYHAKELEEDGFNIYFQGGLRSDENFNAREYLDMTTLKELIDSEDRLIPDILVDDVQRGAYNPPGYAQPQYDQYYQQYYPQHQLDDEEDE